jgi:hypothetical protein
MASLQRAVARRDDDDVALGIREALRLDVARLVEVLLHEALAATEGGDRLASGRFEQLGDLVELAGDLETASAAAVGGLDGDGQADLLGEGDDLIGPATGPGAGASGAPTFSATWRAVTLSPRASIASGEGPIQIMPAAVTARGKSAFSARKP